MKQLDCPILRVDGSDPIEMLLDQIAGAMTC
jgi:hypothetical protein